MKISNSIVANAIAANRKVACNADIYSLVKQEFKAQYPYKDFGIDMRLEPDGKFKIWEVGSAHGPNDSSGVDWKRIAAKVKSAMGSQISSIKATPYNNGVEGVMARNSVARNAYCEAGDYIETRDGGQDTVERVVGDKVYLKSGDTISMSEVKAVLNAKRVTRNAESEKYFEKHLSDILAMMRKVRSDYQQAKKNDAIVKKLLHDAEREFTQAGYDRNTSNALGRLAKEILDTSPFGLL